MLKLILRRWSRSGALMLLLAVNVVACSFITMLLFYLCIERLLRARSRKMRHRISGSGLLLKIDTPALLLFYPARSQAGTTPPAVRNLRWCNVWFPAHGWDRDGMRSVSSNPANHRCTQLRCRI